MDANKAPWKFGLAAEPVFEGEGDEDPVDDVTDPTREDDDEDPEDVTTTPTEEGNARAVVFGATLEVILLVILETSVVGFVVAPPVDSIPDPVVEAMVLVGFETGRMVNVPVSNPVPVAETVKKVKVPRVVLSSGAQEDCIAAQTWSDCASVQVVSPDSRQF